MNCTRSFASLVSLYKGLEGNVFYIVIEFSIDLITLYILTFLADYQKNVPNDATDAECCACDEANYDVEFVGIWSRETHPKDYPSCKFFSSKSFTNYLLIDVF